MRKYKQAPPDRGKGRRFRRLLIPLLILALLLGAGGWYLGSYYPADEAALAAFEAEHPVRQQRLESGDLCFGTGQEEFGLIFYPGARVAQEAYAPLMELLAEKGVFCLLCDMPCHLAIFREDAADGLREAYPAVKHWYLGGHSLGGVMAASYLSKQTEGFSGLILLASYATKDLSRREDLAVLSVYGSEDGVLNRRAYAGNKEYLPPNAVELVIQGGCHAGFGLYGPQRGDGSPAISGTEQIRRTAEAIVSLMRGKEG